MLNKTKKCKNPKNNRYETAIKQDSISGSYITEENQNNQIMYNSHGCNNLLKKRKTTT